MERLTDGTRLTLFLPANDATEAGAVTEIISDLRSRFGGCSHSVLRQPVFRGYWFDPETATLYIDQISLVISDIPLAVNDPALVENLSDVRNYALQVYADLGSVQEEVWTIVQPTFRLIE